MLDFSVMVCTASPQLSHALTAYDSDPSVFLATNSFFPPSAEMYSTEKRALTTYSHVLGANLLLSVFSYFETYFFSAIDEMLDFHGGEVGLEKVISKQFCPRSKSPAAKAALSGLRTTFKPNRADKYRKLSANLNGEKILWPSQRFMLFGLKQAVSQRKRWKAADIPELMLNLLTVDVSTQERDRFHAIRNERNKIAHGKALSYELKKAVDASYFLKNLAQKIDEHIIESFFLIERYAH